MRLSENATDIILPVRDHYRNTRELLEGIYRHTDLPFHIYLIDNSSIDETADLDKIYTRDITVVHNHRDIGWSGGVNQGIALGHRPNVAILRGDAHVAKGWLDNMAAFLNTHPRIGAVGPLAGDPSYWQYIDRVRENVAPQIPPLPTSDIAECNRILQYHFHRVGILIEGSLSFFCVVLKRRTFNAVGPLPERLNIDAASRDYCRRLRKSGYVLGLAMDAYVVRRDKEQPLAPAELLPLPEYQESLTRPVL